MSWLTNCRTSDGRLLDIEVVDGAMAQVVDHDPAAVRPGDDLGSWLVLPAMGEPHAHLDKALTAERVPNPTGDLPGAVRAWADAAATGMFTPENCVERATDALDRLVARGATAVRTHINVTPEVGAVNVEAMLEVKRRFEGVIDLQIVALTGGPMVGPEGAGARAALERAIELGVDVVGGCPHLNDDAAAHVRYAFDMAAEAGLDIDLHTDETLNPSVLTVLDVASRVIETGFAGRVAASHCVSLAMLDAARQAEVAQVVARAGIAVIALPQTNLYLQGRDQPTATPRGLTAVAALRRAGCLVAAGADNVQDPYNLVGRSDPLETAALMVMAGHVLPDIAYDMVSNDVRQALGLDRVEFRPGDPADLMVVDAASVRAAIADAPMNRIVYRQGREVARTS
ncbi:MAG: amidohydrolase family protein, partial [Acidimicrobiales bacterium]|nr:amidohydrolase family protein [Acidimicrobiales bacterium]